MINKEVEEELWRDSVVADFKNHRARIQQLEVRALVAEIAVIALYYVVLVLK